jgi:aminoglycoside 6'-N-acetyltransferase
MATRAAPITFRPLRRDDFALVATWLAEAVVARWWNHETSPEALERDFGPSVDGADATELFLVVAADRPVGLIQRYPIAAYAEYAEELAPVVAVPEGALSIDYLIGEPGARGRGLGAAMLRLFAEDCWRAHPDADDIVVPVAAGNHASWRALERAGFTRVAEGPLQPDNPVDPPDHVVYRLRRPRD